MEHRLGVITVKYELTGTQDPYLYCYECRRPKCSHVKMVQAEFEKDEPSHELDVLDMYLHSPAFR